MDSLLFLLLPFDRNQKFVLNHRLIKKYFAQKGKK
jgi:hypothetical protein